MNKREGKEQIPKDFSALDPSIPYISVLKLNRELNYHFGRDNSSLIPQTRNGIQNEIFTYVGIGILSRFKVFLIEFIKGVVKRLKFNLDKLFLQSYFATTTASRIKCKSKNENEILNLIGNNSFNSERKLYYLTLHFIDFLP
jgi:hypothetical protein